MIKTHKYRLYPSKKQQDSLLNNFNICKEVYNILLAESRTLWTTNKFELNSIIQDIKITCKSRYSQVHSQVLQNVSDRTHKAFSNFFRRIKEKRKEKPGFPRFKSKIKSITYPQSGFKILDSKSLYASKIGNMPIVLHRLPKGKIKTLTIKQNKAGQWFAYLSCEVEDKKIIHKPGSEIGIDVGIEHFAALSSNEFIENPKYLAMSEKRLKINQRRLSRKKKRSKNRKKAKFKLARRHNKISNQRTDFLHQLSYGLAKSHSFIAVENLQIKNMTKNHCLAKSISDASWGAFIQMLSYKVVMHGGQLVKVNPKNTSKTCSSCGEKVGMPLHKRMFDCPKCGLELHRDLNAAINILADGRAGLARTYTPVDRTASAPSVFERASGLEEAGTTRGEPLTATDTGSPAL